MNVFVIMIWFWENVKKDLMYGKVEFFVEEFLFLFIEVVLDGGLYSNEVDMFMLEWREEMYGLNWERLLEVKEKWDLEGVFYLRNILGVDKWYMDLDMGRMCLRYYCFLVKRRDRLERNYLFSVYFICYF